MKTKHMATALIAAVISVSLANIGAAAGLEVLPTLPSAGASNITGFEGQSGVININPATIGGDVGFRQYNQFDLAAGDIANLIFSGTKNGAVRNINSFINLVNNKININGIVNTMRDGNFYNGHAVFISPNGMTVGASGVLNVGTLSVVTPTAQKYNELINDYNYVTNSDNFKDVTGVQRAYKNMANISNLRNGTGNNYGGNAPVQINGTVITRDLGANTSGVALDIRGSQVDINGTIINGYNGSIGQMTGAEQAQALFETLVNTDGTPKAVNAGAGQIVIKSGDSSTSYITVGEDAKVVNLGNADTTIVNHGNEGLTVDGLVTANGLLTLHNNNAASKLSLAGKVFAKDKVNIVNQGSLGMNITGNVGNDNTQSVRIVNKNGELQFEGTAKAVDSVTIRNYDTGAGMTVGGTVEAENGVLVENRAGDLNVNGSLTATKGDVMVKNEGAGKLTTAAASSITAKGDLGIRNNATGGMEINGTVNNNGTTAINNYKGDMKVAGNITNAGNMGIINRETAGKMDVTANVTNDGGKLNVVNLGSGAQTIDGVVANKGGNMYVYSDGGALNVNGTLKNEGALLYVASRKGNAGITTAATSRIENKNGNISIRNENGVNGMNLQGTVTDTNGVIAVNNYKGDMNVSGTATTDDNLGIINRAGGAAMNVDSVTSAKNMNIKNFGSGDMTVNGEITHSGRANVLANENQLNLGATVHNNSNGALDSANGFYAASRANGTGLNVTSTFNGTGNGLYLIKNITGQNGLRYDGNLSNANGQVEIYNKAGDMVVNGNMNGNPAVILNKGDHLTVSESANLQGDVKIVNNGKYEANVPSKYQDKLKDKPSK